MLAYWRWHRAGFGLRACAICCTSPAEGSALGATVRPPPRRRNAGRVNPSSHRGARLPPRAWRAVRPLLRPPRLGCAPCSILMHKMSLPSVCAVSVWHLRGRGVLACARMLAPGSRVAPHTYPRGKPREPRCGRGPGLVLQHEHNMAADPGGLRQCPAQRNGGADVVQHEEEEADVEGPVRIGPWRNLERVWGSARIGKSGSTTDDVVTMAVFLRTGFCNPAAQETIQDPGPDFGHGSEGRRYIGLCKFDTCPSESAHGATLSAWRCRSSRRVGRTDVYIFRCGGSGNRGPRRESQVPRCVDLFKTGQCSGKSCQETVLQDAAALGERPFLARAATPP